MALHAEDEARFADWLNYFGLTEADLGRRAASDPNALEQLRAGTAPPGTLQKVNAPFEGKSNRQSSNRRLAITTSPAGRRRSWRRKRGSRKRTSRRCYGLAGFWILVPPELIHRSRFPTPSPNVVSVPTGSARTRTTATIASGSRPC